MFLFQNCIVWFILCYISMVKFLRCISEKHLWHVIYFINWYSRYRLLNISSKTYKAVINCFQKNLQSFSSEVFPSKVLRFIWNMLQNCLTTSKFYWKEVTHHTCILQVIAHICYSKFKFNAHANRIKYLSIEKKN